MHLHGHLKQTLLDFDPIYAFWLFSFERYNGLLGNIDSNKKGSFEVTFVKRFIQSVQVGDYIRSIAPQLERRQSNFLDTLRESPGTTTTTIRLSSADAFNIE